MWLVRWWGAARAEGRNAVAADIWGASRSVSEIVVGKEQWQRRDREREAAVSPSLYSSSSSRHFGT
jgi:hypothetical protein